MTLDDFLRICAISGGLTLSHLQRAKNRRRNGMLNELVRDFIVKSYISCILSTKYIYNIQVYI